MSFRLWKFYLSSFVACFLLWISSNVVGAEQVPNSWYKLCSKQADNDFCNVQFNVISGSSGIILTSVNLAITEGKNSNKIFQVTVPTRRFIPDGIRAKIDNNEPFVIPYVLCVEDRCMAQIPLEDTLVKSMKSGGTLLITSTNFQNQPNPIEVTLSGFTKAYDGPPLKANELEIRNQKLQDELRSRAKKLREKLQVEQDKAKSVGDNTE